MLMRSYVVCLLLWLAAHPAFVQAQPVQHADTLYHPLKKGDTVPEFRFTNLLNYPSKSARLADFRGKLLILDFWASYCASCIHSWPKLLALQREFGDKIQIILVDPIQRDSIVRKVFEQRKKLAAVDMTLPTECLDSSILKLFPVSGVPHVVWITPEGVVRDITDAGPVNAKNISRILNHEPVEMTQKVNNDEMISPSFEKPMLEGLIKDVAWQSILAKSQQNIFPTLGITAFKGYGYFAVATNMSIVDLYALAYSTRRNMDNHILPFRENRIVLEVADSSKYVHYIEGELNWGSLYNYQLITPPTTEDSIQKAMQIDLQRFFGLQCRIEKRKKKALVFTCSDTSLISYKHGDVVRFFTPYDSVKLNKLPFLYFIQRLEDATAYGISPYPIVDETGIKGLIGNFILHTEVENLKSLDKALSKYRIHVNMEDRWVDVVVLTEPGYMESSKK